MKTTTCHVATAIPRFMLTFAAPHLTRAMADAQDTDFTLESARRVCREMREAAHLTNAAGHHVAEVDASGDVRWL